MLYSFDIFDTLIGRNVVTPDGVFFVMKERMIQSTYFIDKLENDCIREFAVLRKKAEIIAGRSKEFQVTKLDDIYTVLCWLMGSVSMKVTNKIKQLEIDTECKLAFGIEENIEKACRYIRQGERVILISDMYLSSENIKEIITPINKSIAELPIYVSSEWNCTKSDGGLFLKVKDNEDVFFDEWIHVGDDEIADVKIPKLLGIKTGELSKKSKPQIEIYFENKERLKSSVSYLGIGVSRNLRIHKQWNRFEAIGGYVGGGIVFSYALWVIENAVKYSISKLFFVARDGYVIKLVADIIIAERKYNIDTEYIYGSRRAWRVSESEKKDIAIRYIIDKIEHIKNFAFVDLQSTGESMDYLLDGVDSIREVPYFIYGFDYTRRLKKIRPIVYSEMNRGISVEVFCRAPHGVTEGYTVQDDKVVPILREGDCAWSKNHQSEYVKGVMDYTIEMIRQLDRLRIEIDWREYNSDICEYINSMSDRILNDYIGDIIHDSGDNDNEMQYAPELSKKDIDIIVSKGEKIFEKKYYTGCNLSLSMKRLIEPIICDDKVVVSSLDTNIMKKIKIILYTAGRNGRKYLEVFNKREDIDIIGWTDLRAEKYREGGMPVMDIEDVWGLNWDYFVIPMSKTGKMFKSIVNFLSNIGVRDNILGEEDIYSVLLDKSM